ncbi:MAG: TonB-dependent receptor [Saprospiraceae bacterium]
MKQIYLLTVAILLCTFLSAQTVMVLDLTTLQPLPQVSISPSSSTTVLTDDKGKADISSLLHAPSITITYPGYQSLTLSYDELVAKPEILMTESSHVFNEIVVSANRSENEAKDVAQPIEVISTHDLAFNNSQTSADVIQQTGNVFVQKSQLGGGSPIIRGFETNKVLLVIDGVRMNNAIYRGGHLQNIVTLDNAAMQRVEILYGPGAVMYGSDALGGVMHFFTKNPKLSSDGKLATTVNAFVRYSTADEEKTGHVDFSLGGPRLGSLTSFTYSDFGDLKQGSQRDDKYPDFGKRLQYAERQNGVDVAVTNPDPDVQVGSAYKQYDFLQKFTYAQNEHVSHFLNVQYSTSSDVPRYDRLTETAGGTLRFGDWYYGPQKRLFGSYSMLLSRDHGLFDEARIALAYQNIEESRNDRRFGSANINHRIEKLNILSLNADFTKTNGKSEWHYGIEGITNHVNSTATKENIETGVVVPQNTRYPDGGSDVNSAALYLSDMYHVSDHLIIQPGVRLSYNNLKSVFEDKTFFPFPFDEVNQTNTILSGSLGLVWNGDSGWRVSLLGATGFRAPNVDDLSKVFESVQGSVVVPNPDLGPEKTYSVDLGISRTINDKYSVGIDGYYTLYRDAITTVPGTFNGQSQIIYDDSLSNVTMNVNARKAYLYGANAYINIDITKALSLYSTINYTYARIQEETGDRPLDHIPPVFGKTSLNLKIKKFRGEIYAMYNGWKKMKDYNLDGEDNLPFATPEGMPAWMTFNVKGSYQFTKNFTIQLGVENIADQNYRIFASNISAPGRNVVVTVRGSW